MRSVDVLVVGGGPAGLVAARAAAEGAPGAAVAVLERDDAVGVPVRCAEGVGADGLREFLEPEGAPWVSRPIRRVVIVAPDETEVAITEGVQGWVLDRPRFEAHLAELARAAGAEVLTATEAVGMRRDGGAWAVAVRAPRGEETWRARVVIGADGVESMIGRWAGLDTRVAARDMDSAAQVLLEDIGYEPSTAYFQFAGRWAPGGYAWVFPKADRAANVGLSMSALRGDGRPAMRRLEDWIAHRFPGARIAARTVGGVISAPTARRIVADGVLLAGDAAHQVNPFSGGGIITGMVAGRLAGRHAARALAAGDLSAAALEPYHEEWMACYGRDHERWYRVKRAIHELPDAAFDALARTMNGIPEGKRTFGRLFLHALVRHPALIPVAVRLVLPSWTGSGPEDVP